MKKISGSIIKRLRKEYGYVQEDVAPWIGIDRSTYSKKENNKIPFAADEFLYILSELDRRGPKGKPAKSISKILSEINYLKLIK